jgi:uncharacterized protein YndB with AHSA1/START domain
MADSPVTWCIHAFTVLPAHVQLQRRSRATTPPVTLDRQTEEVVLRRSGPPPRYAARDTMSSTRNTRHIRAPRATVYRALVDPQAVARWRVPDGMSCVVHDFDAREGGGFRVSLTYDAATNAGKTAARTDTYHGHFLRLVPDEQVVEVLAFETDDPALLGAVTVTTSLLAADDGTDVVVVFEGLPRGLRPEDNEIGTRMALDKLAALVESR